MNDWQTGLEMLDAACFSTFGVPVVYTPSLENRMELGGVPIALTGILDEKREIVSLMGDGSMDAVILRSVLEVWLAELGIEPMAGDEVTVPLLENTGVLFAYIAHIHSSHVRDGSELIAWSENWGPL